MNCSGQMIVKPYSYAEIIIIFFMLFCTLVCLYKLNNYFLFRELGLARYCDPFTFFCDHVYYVHLQFNSVTAAPGLSKKKLNCSLVSWAVGFNFPSDVMRKEQIKIINVYPGYR